MEIFDNITKTVKDDLAVTIEKGSRLSIAAACFIRIPDFEEAI
ncbi:MAG: hypothetical protein M0Z31_02450 [Clostridia bacterium]|nr:hypothetical protein [Clostridia bacterium]